MVLVAVTIVSMGFINQLITGGPTLYELSYTNQSGPKQFQVFFFRKTNVCRRFVPPCFTMFHPKPRPPQLPLAASNPWRDRLHQTCHAERAERAERSALHRDHRGDRRWHWHWRSVQRIQRAPRRKDILNLDQ